jgi:hypothetical protein
VFTDPLPSNIHPIVVRVGFHGSVFTELSSNNGSHIYYTESAEFAINIYVCGNVVYVYIETTTYRSDIQAFILVTCYTDGKR